MTSRSARKAPAATPPAKELADAALVAVAQLDRPGAVGLAEVPPLPQEAGGRVGLGGDDAQMGAKGRARRAAGRRWAAFERLRERRLERVGATLDGGQEELPLRVMWVYSEPRRMPRACARSSIEVAWQPRAANNRRAAASSSIRAGCAGWPSRGR